MSSITVKISGEIDVYDVNKLRDWLFVELQEQDFVGSFDIEIKEEE